MNYDKLVELQEKYNERESLWLRALVKGAQDLKSALLQRMGIAESYLDDNDKTIPYIRILETKQNQSQASVVSLKDGLAILPDGTLPIAVELKLRVRQNVHHVYMYVGVQQREGQILYAVWDLPDTYEPKTKNWRTLEGILNELEIQLGYYFAHEPATGNRQGLSVV